MISNFANSGDKPRSKKAFISWCLSHTMLSVGCCLQGFLDLILPQINANVASLHVKGSQMRGLSGVYSSITAVLEDSHLLRKVNVKPCRIKFEDDLQGVSYDHRSFVDYDAIFIIVKNAEKLLVDERDALNPFLQLFNEIALFRQPVLINAKRDTWSRGMPPLKLILGLENHEIFSCYKQFFDVGK